MNRLLFFYAVVFLLFCGSFYTSSFAQDSLKQKMDRSEFSPTTIITSVPFNGVRYFIKIAPLTTRNIDHMPISNPEAGPPIIWRDSLSRLLPDTVLRLLPKRQDLLKESPSPKKNPEGFKPK